MKNKLVKLFDEFTKELDEFLKTHPLEDRDYSFENFIKWCRFTENSRQAKADARYYKKNRKRIIKRATEYQKKYRGRKKDSLLTQTLTTLLNEE